MTGSVLDRPASLLETAPDVARPAVARPGGRPARDIFGGGVTLQARLEAAFHAARMEGSTKCPVCHARMTHTRAGAREAAECGGCGTRLS
jgi:ribosomal protein L37AE/L43A